MSGDPLQMPRELRSPSYRHSLVSLCIPTRILNSRNPPTLEDRIATRTLSCVPVGQASHMPPPCASRPSVSLRSFCSVQASTCCPTWLEKKQKGSHKLMNHLGRNKADKLTSCQFRSSSGSTQSKKHAWLNRGQVCETEFIGFAKPAIDRW